MSDKDEKLEEIENEKLEEIENEKLEIEKFIPKPYKEPNVIISNLHHMNTNQQRMVLGILATRKLGQRVITFEKNDFFDKAGVTTSNPELLDDTFKNLIHASVIKIPKDQTEHKKKDDYLAMLSAHLDDEEGTITFKIHEDSIPLLDNLQKDYSIFVLEETIHLSGYSLIWYQFAKSKLGFYNPKSENYRTETTYILYIEPKLHPTNNIRFLFGCDETKNIKKEGKNVKEYKLHKEGHNLKRCVIDEPIETVNEKTGITIKCLKKMTMKEIEKETGIKYTTEQKKLYASQAGVAYKFHFSRKNVECEDETIFDDMYEFRVFSKTDRKKIYAKLMSEKFDEYHCIEIYDKNIVESLKKSYFKHIYYYAYQECQKNNIKSMIGYILSCIENGSNIKEGYSYRELNFDDSKLIKRSFSWKKPTEVILNADVSSEDAKRITEELGEEYRETPEHIKHFFDSIK